MSTDILVLDQLPRPGSATDPGVSEEKRVAHIFVDALVDAGVEVVFALPGGTIAPVLDACLDRPSVEVITTRHESGAMFAAAGYARATGKLGVVCVTSGPGVLNAMTGLASAHCEGIPLLLLAGEVPSSLHGKKALQEGTSHHLNIIAMTRLVAKWAMEVSHADSAAPIITRAIRTALSGRCGPVVLTVPMDISLKTVRVPRIAADVHLAYPTHTDAMDDAVQRAAAALATAHAPVILAGTGVGRGEGAAELLRLAERTQIPVMTTPKAKGLFPETHPLSLGVFGHGGHPSTVEYLARGVDVLLAVATSLSDPGTDGWSGLLRAEREFIQIDLDSVQFGRNYPVTQGLVGEAESLLRAISARVPKNPRHLQFGVRTHSNPVDDMYGDEGYITPQRALWELQQLMPAETIYTCDIGEHLLFATHYLKIDPPGRFLTMNGLASMGSGLGAALGVQLAFRDLPVVAICGDGTFAMLGAEIATATAADLPLIVAVLNDRRFGMVELGNRAIYGRTPSYSTHPMNVTDFARAQGAESLLIQRPDDLLGAGDRLMSYRQKTLVLDIWVDRTCRMPKNKRFEDLIRSSGAPDAYN